MHAHACHLFGATLAAQRPEQLGHFRSLAEAVLLPSIRDAHQDGRTINAPRPAAQVPSDQNEGFFIEPERFLDIGRVGRNFAEPPHGRGCRTPPNYRR
jgi:hypothetical protein